ncbi:MAG: TetR/AcrR family transcriptional regulator [Aquihabitans sp.]
MTSIDTSALSKGEQTSRAILAAAIERFGRDGYRSTTVADIARDAGVSGTLAYAYYPNKEALFLAAIDDDAAGLIQRGLEHLLTDTTRRGWIKNLVYFVAGAVEEHPLARRLLAGLEPDVIVRVLEIPALAELRRVCAERIRDEQQVGTIRPDVDPVTMGNGVITIMLSLLMSLVQLRLDSTLSYAADVVAVFNAALDPVTPPA